MGIRLNSTTTETTTDKKPESASLEEGLELSAENPTQAPVEIAEDVAPTIASPVRGPAAEDDFDEDMAFVIAESNTSASEDMAAVMAESADTLENSKVVARKVDPNYTKQLRDIQESYKVGPDEAMGMMKTASYEELKAQTKFKNVTHDYPAVSKWAQKPENMKVLQKDPDTFKKIEESSKMLGYLGDYGKVALQNVYTVPMMGLHAAVSTGTVSIEDAADMMSQLQDGIDANQITYNRRGLQEIGSGMDKLTTNLKRILPYKFSDDKGDVTLDSLGNIGNKLKKAVSDNDYSFLTRLYKRYKGNDVGLLDFLGTVVKNPSAALLMAGQSAYSIAPGLVAPIAGAAAGGAIGTAVSGVGGPVGATIGAVGASYTTGFAVAYSQFFQEESEKFKNPKTGKIDFRKMYSDPATVARMRNMALKYGAAHGAFEAIGGKLLGKTFGAAKNATKGAKIAALAVETAEQALSEGAGEFTAKLATGKSVGEAASEGISEAVFSVPFTPGAAMVQAVNLARINAKAKPTDGAPKPPVITSPTQINKIVNEKVEATNAIANREIMAEMRETKKSPAVKDAPQQVQELIQESTNPTVEVGTEDGVVLEDRAGQVTEIVFDVNQFESLAQQVGEDPMAMAEHLGPKGVEAYIAAKKGETGTFQVTADEYHRYSDNRPELDDIMYVNDSAMNAVEAKQTLLLAEELEEMMLKKGDEKDEVSFDDEAYHGTPHTVDRFSTEKIGTGEGAQAFGHGLYFTESEQIADYYRERLSRNKGTKGSKYKVELPTSNAMLDWNSKVEEMEPYVKNKVKEALSKVESKGIIGRLDWAAIYKNQDLRNLLQRNNDFGFDNTKQAMNEIGFELKYNKDIAGVWDVTDPAEIKILQDAYAPNVDKMTGEELYKALSNNPAEASRVLNELGIPGIKYKAEGGKSEHRNFVVFDDSNIQIKEAFFDDTIDDGGDEPPPIPEDSFNIWEPITADASQGDLISRPVELIQSTRTAEQRKVAQKIRTQVLEASKKAGFSPELAEAIAAIQFSHQRFRAETTGENISSLSDTTQVSFSTKLGNSWGKMTMPKGHTAPDTKVIFAPGAKASTVVHEFAHSWLHNMTVDFNSINENLTRTRAQQSYYDAMNQVAKMFDVENVGEIYNKSPEEIKRIHETFARTAELYFLEGKHENNSMRRIFETVRKWMADVASRVLALDRRYPALQLNGEIERMFSTILDASREAHERTVEMFPEPLFTEEMLGPEKAAKYKEAMAQATDEAVAEIYGNSFNGSLREQEKLISDSLDQIQLQAENEVNELPAIVLMDLIKARGPDAKITYQSILDHLAFGDADIMEQIKSFIAPGVMAPNKRRGIDVREVMEAFNVSDPNDMVTMLAQMKNRDQLVDARANQLMDEMFPPLKTDDEMHAIAVKAVQESGREKILKMDLDILAEKHMATLQQMNEDAVKSPLNAKRKPMAALKDQAAVRVQQGDLKAFKPATYLKEATKFNKQAAGYVRQGDYLAAFDAKQREAVNTFAYLESLKVAKQITKVNADVKKLLRLSPNEIGDNYDFDIYTGAKEIATEFQLGRTISDPADITGFDKMRGDKQKIVSALIEAMNLDLSVKDPGNPAVETLLNLGQVVKLMRSEARGAKTIEINGKIEDRAEVVARINNELTQNKNILSFDKGGWTKWRSGIAMVDNIFAGMMTESEYAGSTILGKVSEVRDAENTFIKMENRDNEILSAAIKKMNTNNPEAQKITNQIKSATASYFGMDLGKPVAAKEIDHIFSNKGELLKARAISMSEDGYAKLLAGGIKSKGKEPTGPIEAAKLDDMWARMERDGTITEADMDFVQAMLDIFESHYDAVKAGARKVDGFDIGYIKARPVNAFGKTYKGGYIPLKRGEDMAQVMAKKLTVDVDDNFIPEFYPVTNTSQLKQRTGKAYPVNVDLGTLRSELNAVYKVAYVRPTMYDMGKILSDPSFVATMESRRPGAMNNIIAPWFQKTMTQQYIERLPKDKINLEGLELVVNAGIRNARRNVFLGNFNSVLKQGIGVIPAMEILPMNKIGLASAKTMVAPFSRRDHIASVSPIMAERFDNNSQNIIRSLEEFSANDTWDKKGGRLLDKLTYWPIQIAQNYVDTVVWTAAFDTATIKFKLDEQKAIEYANNVILRTQSSNNVSAVPNLRSGTVFSRMWTTFATVPIAMGAMQLEAKGRAKGKNNLEYMTLMARSYMFTAALPAMFAAVVSLPAAGLALIGGDDDERDEAFDALAMRSIPEALDSIFPVAGQNIVGLFGGYDFDPRFAQVGVLPLASQVIQGAKGARAGVGRALPEGMADVDNRWVQALYNEFSLDEFSNKDLRNLALGFTLMTGIPTGAIPLTFNRVENTATAVDRDLDMEAVINDIDLPR